MWPGAKFLTFLPSFLVYLMPSSHKKTDGGISYLLVDDNNHVYRWKRNTKKHQVWNCCKKEERSCKAEVRTNREFDQVRILAFTRRLVNATAVVKLHFKIGTHKSSCECQLFW